MFQSPDIIWTLLGAVLLILGTFWASWSLIRPKIAKVLKEAGELSQTAGKALEDNKISQEERDALTKEFKEFKEAILMLTKKEEEKKPSRSK